VIGHPTARRARKSSTAPLVAQHHEFNCICKMRRVPKIRYASHSTRLQWVFKGRKKILFHFFFSLSLPNALFVKCKINCFSFLTHFCSLAYCLGSSRPRDTPCFPKSTSLVSSNFFVVSSNFFVIPSNFSPSVCTVIFHISILFLR